MNRCALEFTSSTTSISGNRRILDEELSEAREKRRTNGARGSRVWADAHVKRANRQHGFEYCGLSVLSLVFQAADGSTKRKVACDLEI
jgi:hypothetical protein